MTPVIQIPLRVENADDEQEARNLIAEIIALINKPHYEKIAETVTVATDP